MNIGIVCEFNPFHSGHKYLIDSVKNEGDKVICVMSGNYVQRGEFAVFNKFERAKTALQNGADLVIELPPEQALLSAEGFAKSAVELLESLGVTDMIAFGAECDDIKELYKAAEIIKTQEFQNAVKEEMKSGISYPAARAIVFGNELINSPNNILAVEYIKSTHLPVKAVKRIGKGHDTDDEEYSASAIRKTLNPDCTASIYNCEKALFYRLRSMGKGDFKKIADVNEGLENRIFEAVRKAESYDELLEMIKSKRYTLSRIRRIIMRAYLGIEGTDTEVPCVRVLGFNSNGRELLSQIKKNCKKPVVSRMNDFKNGLESYYDKQCRYTDIYNLAYKKTLPCGAEQRSQIVVI